MRAAKKLDNSGEMNIIEAAYYCRKMSPKTLRNLMATNQGPRVTKIGGRLIFLAGDLDAWMKNRTIVRKAFGR